MKSTTYILFSSLVLSLSQPTFAGKGVRPVGMVENPTPRLLRP